MADADPRIEAFFAADDPWRAELLALRAILLAGPLAEAWKWRAPVYTAHDGNVATLWGLKEGATLSFFKGALLDDPSGLLAPPGPASRSARVAKFRSVAEIEAQAGTLAGFVAAAVENERLGRKVEMPADDLALPEELQARLDADPALAEAFAALTPGRRRGWILHVGRAQRPETRETRLDQAAPRILAGKGLHDR